MGRLVIEETSVYEIDEDCVKRKGAGKAEETGTRDLGEGLREKKERSEDVIPLSI